MAAGDVRILEGNPKQYKAASFNGTSNEINVADGPKFKGFTTNISGSCWARNNSNGLAATEALFSKANVAGNQREFYFYLNSAEKLNVYLSRDGGTVNAMSETSTSAVTLENWHHYGFTYDAGTIVLYVDGVAIPSGTTGAEVTMYNGTAQFLIGNDDGSTNWWGGNIFDVKYFNKTLTPAEMYKCYIGDNSRDGLVGEWKLQDNFNDTSGNGLNGINEGSTITTTDSSLSRAIQALPTGATAKNYFCHTEKGDMAVLNIEGA